MEHLIIRPAGLQDLARLQQIGRQTFAETFAGSNSAENMRAYLADNFAADQLTAELQHPDSAFYFAELAGAIVGYLKVNAGAAQTEPQGENALEIERIYVLQQYHGWQVGQRLYERALALARQARAAYLWLGVWEENRRAIRFYQKNGFVAFGQHVFRLGTDEQTDIIMKLPLAG